MTEYEVYVEAYGFVSVEAEDPVDAVKSVVHEKVLKELIVTSFKVDSVTKPLDKNDREEERGRGA